MNTLVIIVAAFPALLVVGVILGPVLSRRHSERLHDLPIGGDDDSGDARARVQGATTQESEAGPEAGLRAEELYGAGEGDQYFEDWTALQARFIE